MVFTSGCHQRKKIQKNMKFLTNNKIRQNYLFECLNSSKEQPQLPQFGLANVESCMNFPRWAHLEFKMIFEMNYKASWLGQRHKVLER